MRRFAWEREVLKSGLPAPVRHLLLTLAVYADWPSGTTPAEHTPSLTTLAAATGLGRSTVVRGLDVAEAKSWLVRHRPPVTRARADKERTRYTLLNPASPRVALATSATAGPPSATAGPELVPERDGASATAGHKPERSQNLPEAAAASDEERAAVNAEIRRRKPGATEALVRHIEREDGAEILAELRASKADADLKTWYEWAITQPPCPHGIPGGDAIHPRSGRPRVECCRTQARTA